MNPVKIHHACMKDYDYTKYVCNPIIYNYINSLIDDEISNMLLNMFPVFFVDSRQQLTPVESCIRRDIEDEKGIFE